MEPLPSRYDPKSDTRLYSHWESKGYFRPKSDREGKKFRDARYVIVIPPPNVTGILHMGHALNNTIQDILTRWNRMKGRDTLWVPGVDHAGIATQNVVEKKLAKEKKTRHDLGREKFLREVWKWKEEHGSTITKQLRRLGASCDWSRERFTMDEGLSLAVREAFVTLYERGLIYQGNYIINWCPRCQTALSDEESAHKEVTGGLYHIKYPLKGTVPQKGQKGDSPLLDHIVVATTRPETMLGDTALAVHPEDARYKHLIGKKVILPLLGREIPIIGDEFVDREFGTGFVKVTPAHDPNDFEMGQRHNLPRINILNPDGTINENGGPYQGLDRFEARKKVVADLEAQNLFVRRDLHSHSVGHCYRCETVVEPYLSKQWFVKMKPLAEKALKAHREGKTVFYPDRWTKVYTNWLENIRDWCISRQIWWGHQIPVWYCEGDSQCRLECKKPIVSRQDPKQCPACGSKNLRQDPDVLDTWFSSWLWPFSTLGWPDSTEDLKYFYPTSDLITAPEIIFFWVARMIMAGLEFMGEAPFSRIYIHGTVRAQTGLKMSKSLGNAIDPLEVIDEMGADALRFSMIMLSAQDVYLSREKFEVGRNFVNKLWNASRFVLMNLEEFKEGGLSFNYDLKSTIPHTELVNLWILWRLHQTIQTVSIMLQNFHLSQAATELYHFVWNDFCDWYIEFIKPVLSGNDCEQRIRTQRVLYFALLQILHLLHPFMPFVTEEVWGQLKSKAKDEMDWPETIMLSQWPTSHAPIPPPIDFSQFQKIISGIRDLRTTLSIQADQKLRAVIVTSDNISRTFMTSTLFKSAVKRLANLQDVEIKSEFQKNKQCIGNIYGNFAVFISIEGLVDAEKERGRIQKKIEETGRYLKTLQQKLANENFIKNAPPGIVDEERGKLADAEKVLKSHQELLSLLQK